MLESKSTILRLFIIWYVRLCFRILSLTTLTEIFLLILLVWFGSLRNWVLFGFSTFSLPSPSFYTFHIAPFWCCIPKQVVFYCDLVLLKGIGWWGLLCNRVVYVFKCRFSLSLSLSLSLLDLHSSLVIKILDSHGMEYYNLCAHWF